MKRASSFLTASEDKKGRLKPRLFDYNEMWVVKWVVKMSFCNKINEVVIISIFQSPETT